MSEETSLSNKGRAVLLASVAANIFLVAFLLGRSGGHLPPPPLPAGGQGAFPPAVSQEAPSRQDFARRDDMRGPDFRRDGAGREEMGHRGGMPPMFGPGDLFGAGEMKQDEARMHENFEKMDALRKGFVEQLRAGSVSKEAVLKHFADIDQVMDGVKKEAQTKAADRISAMSAEERTRFADMLAKRGEEGKGGRAPEGREDGQGRAGERLAPPEAVKVPVAK